MSSLWNYFAGDPESSTVSDVKAQSSPVQTFADNQIFASALGRVSRFEAEDKVWEEAQGTYTAFILDTGSQFDSKFTIVRQSGDPIFSKALNENLQIRFEAPNRSMNWLVESEDQVHQWRFTFQDVNEEESMKEVIAIRLLENVHQKPFKKIIGDNDKGWVIDAQEEGQFDQDFEDENEFYADGVGTYADEVSPPHVDDPLATEEMDGYKKQTWRAQLDVPEVQENCNTQIDGSMLWNRAYVIRNQAEGAELGLFKHADNNMDLKYIGKVAIEDKEGNQYQPTKMLTHRQDAQLLFTTEQNKESIAVMDLYRGQIVEEWCPGRGDIRDLCPEMKYAQRTDNQCFKLCTKNAYMTIDPRTKEKAVHDQIFQMKTNPDFSTMCTTGKGHWAIGSADGSIRMYNKSVRAKTKLPGLGKKIKNIEVTEDGCWLLATCEKYLLLVNTTMPDSEKLGFEVRMGKKKPKPYKLRLKGSDMQMLGISPQNISFTKARFNVGENQEKWIVTSTGRFVIKWNFSRAKLGYTQDYLISQRKGKVNGGAFRYNRDDDLLVLEEHDVYCQQTRKR